MPTPADRPLILGSTSRYRHELLSRLRKTTAMPVIFLTSKDDEVDEVLGLRMGADDYITKPFSQRLLIERIRSLLRRQELQREKRPSEAEAAIALDASRPVEALTEVIRFVHGYYRRNPDFVTLLNTENLHKGRHIVKSVRAREYSSPAIEIIRQLLASGQAQGLFRPDISARDLYLLIAANGYFYMSNRHTLSAFLGEDLEAPEALAHWEEFVVDTVLRAVAPAATPTPTAPPVSPARTG